jgi:predicted dinucleotide-binding enzyme
LPVKRRCGERPAAACRGHPGADPVVEGGRRVVFLSSDDEDAIAPVAALAKHLGVAPVNLGKLREGGALVHARGHIWGRPIIRDMFKKEPCSACRR